MTELQRNVPYTVDELIPLAAAWVAAEDPRTHVQCRSFWEIGEDIEPHRIELDVLLHSIGPRFVWLQYPVGSELVRWPVPRGAVHEIRIIGSSMFWDRTALRVRVIVDGGTTSA